MREGCVKLCKVDCRLAEPGFVCGELGRWRGGEVTLAERMGLGDGVRVNPSGGALAANSLMTAGLILLGEAANRVLSGDADRALAHTTNGVCLQHNLVAVLEGE